VGYTIPKEFCTLIEGIFKNVPNIEKAVVSVHCHNDFGLAVANTIAAVEAGASQVQSLRRTAGAQDAALTLLFEHRLHLHADLYLAKVNATNKVDDAGIGAIQLDNAVGEGASLGM
jgi:hypothetical protein